MLTQIEEDDLVAWCKQKNRKLDGAFDEDLNNRIIAVLTARQNTLRLFAKLRAIATCHWWISSQHYAAKQLQMMGCCFQEKAINSRLRPLPINLVFHPNFQPTPNLCANPS